MTDTDKEYQQELLQASIELVHMFDVRWIKPIHGVTPIQAEGIYNGQYFYFRARYDHVKFVLAPDENWNYEDDVIKLYNFTVTQDEFGAGTLTGNECIIAIAMFLQMVLDTDDNGT